MTEPLNRYGVEACRIRNAAFWAAELHFATETPLVLVNTMARYSIDNTLCGNRRGGHLSRQEQFMGRRVSTYCCCSDVVDHLSRPFEKSRHSSHARQRL